MSHEHSDEIAEIPTPAEASAEQVAAESQDEPTAAAPAKAEADPVVAVLLRIALALIVIVLITAATMFFVVRGRHAAPRTVVERDVATWEAAVREKPTDAMNWTRLAYAYSEAHRYSEGVKAARQGRSVTNDESLWLAEADVLRAARRYTEAIAAYDQAEKAISAAEDAAKRKLEQENIYVPIGDDSMAYVYYGRGIARHEIGDDAKAIADLKKAVAAAPDQAQMLIVLGDYQLDAGDKTAAAEAYKQALRYVPDAADALAGLKKAGGR